MKAFQFALATAAVTVLTAWSGYALAGNDNSNGGCQGNCPTTGGGATSNTNSNTANGGTGVGIGLGVGIAGAQSDSSSRSSSSSQGGDATANGGNGGTATQGQSATGYGGTANGQGSGNQTSVNVGGSTYKESAQTAYAPTVQQPRTSCRIFLSIGGSSTSGSLSGGIPLANDQSCVSGLQVELMDKVNAHSPGTFKTADFLAAVCAVEGMEKMSACQK